MDIAVSMHAFVASHADGNQNSISRIEYAGESFRE
jgi:hypothetical protein